jgi:REP element-mobilizing transposase RayT
MMGEPLGYFLTWTTYGTWLPGDHRGWVSRRHRTGNIIEESTPSLEAYSQKLLSESPAMLDTKMRAAADEAIRQTCQERTWWLHALSVRSNHVHVVLSARDADPGKTTGILKASATKSLNRLGRSDRKRWWTRGGSKRILNSQVALEAAIRYVLSQDVSWKKDR